MTAFEVRAWPPARRIVGLHDAGRARRGAPTSRRCLRTEQREWRACARVVARGSSRAPSVPMMVTPRYSGARYENVPRS
eukprot:3596170-Prymnesium_polylepis.3